VASSLRRRQVPAFDMDSLDRDRLFSGLTRPQLLLGVTYGFAVINAVLTTELFLIFKSVWVLVAAVMIHFAGRLACASDPHIFELWLARARYCPRIPNYRIWNCNSYSA
jgi:type IV secretion system protein VirB3